MTAAYHVTYKSCYDVMPTTCLRRRLWVCLVVVVALIRGARLVDGDEVFSSSAHLKILAQAEQWLVNGVERYLVEERARLDRIERYVLEARQLSGNPAHLDPEHPINALHLIKRFTTTWVHVWATVCDFSNFEGLKAILNELQQHSPLVTDYDSAKAALIRLQITYQLSLETLAKGEILGYRTLPLSLETIIEIGKHALLTGDADSAISWLSYALKELDLVGESPIIPRPELLVGLGRSYALGGQFSKALDFIKQAVDIDSTNPAYIRDILPDQPIEIEVSAYNATNYASLCRQAVYSISESSGENRQLQCALRSGRFNPLYLHRIEMLHASPDITIVHDFITNEESDLLRSAAISKIHRGRVGKSTQSRISDQRTGKIAWFPDTDNSLVSTITRRVSDFTHLNVNYPAGELLQLANYGIGGHYAPHYDSDEFRRNLTESELCPEIAMKGDRLATFMIYLNDVIAGGATVFPRINLAARPIKNSALFWYNYHRSGDMDFDSLHAACPVLIGEKWVANKWIREFGQEFLRPCALTRAA